MAVKLFALRGVPDDEATEIRELLTEAEIDWYETPAGNWGMSMPAIWMNDEEQLQKAKLLIEEYQRERLVRVRKEYEQLKIVRKSATMIDKITENPIRFFVYLAIVLGIVYLSIKPFIDFGE